MHYSPPQIPILIKFSFSMMGFVQFLLSVAEILCQHTTTGISACVRFIEMNTCFTRNLSMSRNMCIKLHSPKCQALARRCAEVLGDSWPEFLCFTRLSQSSFLFSVTEVNRSTHGWVLQRILTSAEETRWLRRKRKDNSHCLSQRGRMHWLPEFGRRE